MTRDVKEQQVVLNNDKLCQGMTRDVKEWQDMSRDIREWKGMSNNGEGFKRIIRDDWEVKECHGVSGMK